jgi:MFS family permease
MTTTTDPLVRDSAAGAARGRWLMLIVLLAGQFMALLDVTIVNVAMPTIGRSLHASGAELQLVVAGYTVSYAMMLITGARMGDLYGRRRMFLAGVAVFTASSLACGVAPGIGILIAARFVQGAGAAAMMPQIMSVIQVRFDGAARASALSAYTAVLSSGAVAGQVIGGVLVTANLFGQTWRPVFLVNVPIGLAVLATVPRVVPRDEPGLRRRQLDLFGLAVAVPAVFLVVLPLMLGHQEDWPGWVFACLAAGLALAVAFVLVERRIADRGGDPLLNLEVLRAPGLVPGLAAVAVIMITYGGFLFSFALHLQTGLGDSALRAGLTFAPCALVFGFCGYFWRRLPSRPRPGTRPPPAGPRGLPGGGGRVPGRGPRPALGEPGRAGAAGRDGRNGGVAGARVQPPGHPCPGAGADAPRRGRERAAYDHDPAGTGDRGGDVRQPVPDARRGPGADSGPGGGLGARAGHHPGLAGRGGGVRGDGRGTAGPDSGHRGGGPARAIRLGRPGRARCWT